MSLSLTRLDNGNKAIVQTGVKGKNLNILFLKKIEYNAWVNLLQRWSNVDMIENMVSCDNTKDYKPQKVIAVLGLCPA